MLQRLQYESTIKSEVRRGKVSYFKNLLLIHNLLAELSSALVFE